METFVWNDRYLTGEEPVDTEHQELVRIINLVGALEAGAQGMQREAGVPAVAVQVTEAIIILVIVLAEVLVRRTGAIRASQPGAEER